MTTAAGNTAQLKHVHSYNQHAAAGDSTVKGTASPASMEQWEKGTKK